MAYQKILFDSIAILFAAASAFNIGLIQTKDAGDISLDAIAIMAQAQNEANCDDGFCVIMGYKNRFLAKGCKEAPEYVCAVQKFRIK